MDHSLLWVGFLPIIIFVILDSFTSKKNAVYSAAIFAATETLFTIIKFKKIDELTVLSLVLVVGLGIVTIKKDNVIYFKLQPVALGIFTAIIFFVFYYFLNKPLLNFMFEKYFSSNIEGMKNSSFNKDRFHALLNMLSRDMGWWILFHSALTCFAAFKLSKWWWLFIRVPGLYIILFLGMFFEINVFG